jgi:glycosyltransferase involved in cell wall biosynthesis
MGFTRDIRSMSRERSPPAEKSKRREDTPRMTDIELTILMPCLNEAETLAACIADAKGFLERFGVTGEVVVADNGSTDGSQGIAEAAGARLVAVPTRGYGAALQGGIAAARGMFVIMADADGSYDFSGLLPFVERLRAGADVVMGNRFAGGIDAGAMPLLHRYLGNPVLSFLGRLFFRLPIADFHCGIRGFNRTRIQALDLRTTGMEFASEMVVRAGISGYRIDEVPTRLRRDGRSRPPHLRTWRDGWRHLSFLLIYSPRWLFLYPGLVLLGIGAVAAAVLLPGPVKIGEVSFDIHSFLVACMATIVGVQSVSFAALARKVATAHAMLPASRRYSSLLEAMTLERLLVIGGILVVLGLAGFLWCVAHWASSGFGPLTYADMLRVLILSLTAMAIGIQLALTAFLGAILGIRTVSSTADPMRRL